MEVKPTNELDEILERTDPEHIDRYYKENSRFLADEKKGFRYYIKTTLEEKNIKMKDVYSFAGVTESYHGKEHENLFRRADPGSIGQNP